MRADGGGIRPRRLEVVGLRLRADSEVKPVVIPFVRLVGVVNFAVVLVPEDEGMPRIFPDSREAEHVPK